MLFVSLIFDFNNLFLRIGFKQHQFFSNIQIKKTRFAARILCFPHFFFRVVALPMRRKIKKLRIQNKR